MIIKGSGYYPEEDKKGDIYRQNKCNTRNIEQRISSKESTHQNIDQEKSDIQTNHPIPCFDKTHVGKKNR